jgi:UDP-N-acetylmuramoyl-L-alanyl-D-glutamate--2,6-diaminopimelate ligase
MIRTLKNFYHRIVADIACIVYGNPSRRITVIGVTGTDGKTTTSSLIYHILTSAGRKASMVSTVYAKIGAKEYDTGFHVSTPHSFTVQRFLKESADNGDEFFVMETTSHALDQYRVHGVRYEVGVLTNITHEHLDYHGTYDAYAAAKTKLLAMARVKVINRDDQSYETVSRLLGNAKGVVTYGLSYADYAFDVSEKIGIPLPAFNKYNYLAAYVACHKLGLKDDAIFEAMKTFPLPPGRMEVISDGPVRAIVDFAHTPHSIKEALSAIRNTYLNDTSLAGGIRPGRLIHVFGAASKRDEAKRPIMGNESGRYADLVVLTEEDYREDDPADIAAQIAEGLVARGFRKVDPALFGTESKTYTVIPDRGEAIRKAASIALPGDVIVATGKGHEKSLCRGTTETPWDEQSALRDALGVE